MQKCFTSSVGNSRVIGNRPVNTALQKSLATIDTAVDESGSDNPVHRPMARGLLRGYDLRWHKGNERAKAIESEFRCHIYNLSGKRISRSRTFDLAGKIDVDFIDATDQRQLWIMDHKTTSDKISEPDGTYWRQLAVEGQANLYLLAKQIQGVQVAGAIWDVIRKPGIRPKKLSKAEQKSITSLGTYFGHHVSEETKQHVIAEGRENGELYEQRVFRECQDNPAEYFQRRPVLRLQSEMLEYADELWELARDVLACRQRVVKTNRPPVRNCGSCMAYGTPCEYLGICSGYDSPESDKWQPRESVHSELTSIEGDGRGVLTSSRLKCFQACKRKHYYRYELGIERVDAKVSDALTFGTIMHSGLETWWSHFPAHPAHEGD